MQAHNVLEYMFNLAYQNWTPYYSLGLFSISVATFSSAVAILCCSSSQYSNDRQNRENETDENVRLLSLEHNVGSIASGLTKLKENYKKSMNQVEYRLDIQESEQEAIRKDVTFLENRYDKIEECLKSEEEEDSKNSEE